MSNYKMKIFKKHKKRLKTPFICNHNCMKCYFKSSCIGFNILKEMTKSETNKG